MGGVGWVGSPTSWAAPNGSTARTAGKNQKARFYEKLPYFTSFDLFLKHLHVLLV